MRFSSVALVDGDLPSKAGAAELRELGYVMTQDTVTRSVVSIISTFHTCRARVRHQLSGGSPLW
jgi:hypothetical protein